jgi:hypothetical protein
MRDTNALLHQFEIDTAVACALLAAAALVVPGGGGWLAVSVLAGGVLVWGSYRALKASVDAVIAGSEGRFALVNVFTRYGMLGLGAYVMLARLRLHPVGVVIGASSLALAAAAAAVRALRSSGSVQSSR